MAFIRWNEITNIWEKAADESNPSTAWNHLPIANPTQPLDTVNKQYVDGLIPSVAGLVPYTGAVATVNLNTQSLFAGPSTFSSGGTGRTFNIFNGPYGLLTINNNDPNLSYLGLHFGGVVAWQLGFATDSSLIFSAGNPGIAIGAPRVKFNTTGEIFEQGRGAAMGNWIAYSPTWKGSDGSTGVVGNGELTGKYALVGKTVIYQIRFVIGSTTVQPNGVWGFGAPLGIGVGGASFLGSALLNVNGAFYPSMVVTGNIISGPTLNHFVFANQNGYNGAGVPAAWAAGSYIFCGGTYEF